MALTTKIKVNTVQAGDPHLSFTLESDDPDSEATFPSQVLVGALMYSAISIAPSYYGATQQSGGSAAPINFTIQFGDPNYANETSLKYILTIYFSDGNGGWTAFTGAITGNSGTVTCSHT